MEIDLNKVDNNGEVLENPSAVAPPASSSSSSVCLELWHACAGPLISLPRKGSIVVYFPQGHLEQAPEVCALAHDVPAHLFCRVLNVNLHAELATDEVYAQVVTKLLDGDGEGSGEEEEIEDLGKSTTPHMFCKTLTASNTSMHGGFSVTRRAVEDQASIIGGAIDFVKELELLLQSLQAQKCWRQSENGYSLVPQKQLFSLHCFPTICFISPFTRNPFPVIKTELQPHSQNRSQELLSRIGTFTPVMGVAV